LSTLVMNCVENRPEDRPADMATVIHRLELAVHQLKQRNEKAAPTAT
jgi:hypothetical protein